MEEDKGCFFIAPIGDKESDTRNRTDDVMEFIVKEAVADFGYTVERADKIDQPGSITSQIIEKIVESDLVIADLTDQNPNVFYELAVRHATGEPYIQIINSPQSIPFDISDIRTIQYGLNVAEAEEARNEIRSQLKTLRDDEPEFDNPISKSAEMQSLRESHDPVDQNLADLVKMMGTFHNKLERLEKTAVHNDMKIIEEESDHRKTLSINDKRFTITGNSINRLTLRELASDLGISSNELEKFLQENGINVE